MLLVASCCQPGCWGAKMPLSWQGEDCWSAPGLLCCNTTLRSSAGDLIHSRYLVALALALSSGTPGGYCHGLWPLCPTVLHHFSAACFTCPSQAAAVAVAGGQRGKPCVLCHTFPWGGSQSRLTSAFIPVHLKACNWPTYLS